MGTYFFFFDFGTSGASATLVGQWAKVIACYSDQPRVVLHGGTGSVQVHGGSDEVEIEG